MAQGDSVITCANKDFMIALAEMLNGCFGEDANGKPYLRLEMYTQDAEEGNAVKCANLMLTPEEQLTDLVRRSIVMNSEGKPSLRVGIAP